MFGGPLARQKASDPLLPVDACEPRPWRLDEAQVERLWTVVDAVHRTWGDPLVDPLVFRSQWLEFLTVKCEQEPSYLAEYRRACQVLDELAKTEVDLLWDKLFFEAQGIDAKTNLGRLRKYVVEEFIKVWLAAGGFKAYGAGNYNGHVSGSRFAVSPAYRRP